MKILGISAFYHDSAAALTIDGDIIAAAQEERFTRKKHDASFPRSAVRYCLEHSGLSLGELDAVVFYDKPLLKFERLLETYLQFAPKGIRAFLAGIPVWLKEKMFLKRLIREELTKIDEDLDFSKIKLLFPEHHLSHAASAFFPSPFERAAILTIDGVGEWATASFCLGEKNRIRIIKELRFPHSLGLLYSAFTYFLGFKVNSGEYKLMGLAPYGNAASEDIGRYIQIIKKHLVDIMPDGSIRLDQDYFEYAYGLKMVNDQKWAQLFGFPKRNSEDELKQHHCNLGVAIQQVTEDVVILMAREVKRLTGAKDLCLAGGVALNCVANGKLINEGIFENIFVQPASGDAGGALGAALAAHYLYFDQQRTPQSPDAMKGTYLGPEFSDLEVERAARKFKAVYRRVENFDVLAADIAKILAAGDVVGWFQGRMEFGPRALGNRSIIADARNTEMQKKLNLKIKYRESFRPFAPAVIAEEASDYFELKGTSPYMLVVQPVVDKRRAALPAGYDTFSVKDKLYYNRSDIPAVTHIDFSARIQTVHRETNERFWKLIHAFKEATGYALLVNTSFNVRGEPIVCTPEDAYRCFIRTEMDCLVMGNYVFDKKSQPPREEKTDWQKEFVLD